MIAYKMACKKERKDEPREEMSEKDRNTVRDIVDAPRKGEILGNLQNADFKTYIWEGRPAAKLFNAKLTEYLRGPTRVFLESMRKMERNDEVVLVLIGLDGLTVDVNSPKKLVEEFQGTRLR